ncbi:MAG: DNA primase [Proteobacteria bacterium]|nr:DNA primase [Pseudomonadota bacterium]
MQMAGRIPKAFIDELISRTDIVDLIGTRIQLKKAGREYKACCPFHDEKTPSFTVSQAKQFYHCFGCNAHGTALGFLMEYDRLEFVEAVETLAATMGMEVPHEGGSAAPRQDQNLYPLLADAEKFFCERLKKDDRAIAYLKKRGLSGETAARFGIGYAADAWDELLRELGADSQARKRMVLAGLVIEKDHNKVYDRFRDRIMFPIRDSRGRCIGFGGRVLDKGEPKYLNSPETSLFHKGRELYGLYEARQQNRELARLIVVEGYMDVVGLAQHGITNAVATLGTATTAAHLRRLFQASEEIVFCFDGDKAGRAAAWRALENALPQTGGGHQIRFLFLPDGQDPDSVVRENGADTFASYMAQSETLSEYLMRHLSEQVDMSKLDGKARFAELARPLLRQIPPGAFRELLAGEIAELAGAGNRLARQLAEDGRRPKRAPRSSRSSGRGDLVRQAVTTLLRYPTVAAHAGDTGWLLEMEGEGCRILGLLLEDALNSPNITTAMLLERHRDDDQSAALMKLAASESLVDEEQAIAEFRDALSILSRQSAGMRLDTLLDNARHKELNADEKKELKDLLAKRQSVEVVVDR